MGSLFISGFISHVILQMLCHYLDGKHKSERKYVIAKVFLCQAVAYRHASTIAPMFGNRVAQIYMTDLQREKSQKRMF